MGLGEGRSRRGMRGVTMVETTWVLGIVSALVLVGLSSLSLSPVHLTAVQSELEASLDQAFTEARAKGRNMVVALGHQVGNAQDLVPVVIPRQVKWGKPTHVPLPKGMAEPKVADTTGEAHARITVTPRRTVTAGAWFFHQGEDTICLRLSGHGKVTLLRWRPTKKCWIRSNT